MMLCDPIFRRGTHIGGALRHSLECSVLQASTRLCDAFCRAQRGAGGGLVGGFRSGSLGMWVLVKSYGFDGVGLLEGWTKRHGPLCCFWTLLSLGG